MELGHYQFVLCVLAFFLLCLFLPAILYNLVYLVSRAWAAGRLRAEEFSKNRKSKG